MPSVDDLLQVGYESDSSLCRDPCDWSMSGRLSTARLSLIAAFRKETPMRPLLRLLLLLACTMPQAVQAFQYELFEHSTVSARASTLGLGGEIRMPLFAQGDRLHLAVRVGAAGFRYNRTDEKDQVSYKTTWNLMSGYGLIDWHPWQGAFRVSVGLVLNGNSVDIEARPTAGGFTFGTTFYPSANVDKVDGKIDFNLLSPYLGLGWDWGTGSERNFSFSADLGVMYHGAPAASLTANCGPLLTPVQCAALRADVEREEDQLNNDLSPLRWYPVAALNGTLRF